MNFDVSKFQKFLILILFHFEMDSESKRSISLKHQNPTNPYTRKVL